MQPGDLVVNLSDGSNSLVTRVTATSLTVSGLIGGAENDLDNGDRYVVSPFMTRSYTLIQSGCNDATMANPPCEFDDLIVWISPAVLLNRLVEARRLPWAARRERRHSQGGIGRSDGRFGSDFLR